MTRKALLPILIACLAAALFAAGKPDITGTWVLNVSKSKLGKMPRVDGMSMKLTQNGEMIHAVQSTMDGSGGGSKDFTSDWFMDGKVHPVDPGATAAGNKMTTMSKWEGNTLVAQRKSADGTFVENMKITFSNDNKTATQHVTAKTPNGNNTSTMVWEKK